MWPVVSDSALPWTTASRVFCPWDFPKEYWSEFPFPPPGDLPNKGIKPTSLVSPALAGGILTMEPPGKPTRGLAAPKYSGASCFLNLFIRIPHLPLQSLPRMTPTHLPKSQVCAGNLVYLGPPPFQVQGCLWF